MAGRGDLFDPDVRAADDGGARYSMTFTRGREGFAMAATLAGGPGHAQPPSPAFDGTAADPGPPDPGATRAFIRFRSASCDGRSANVGVRVALEDDGFGAESEANVRRRTRPARTLNSAGCR